MNMSSCTYGKAERTTWYNLENELHKRCGYFSGWPNPQWYNCDSIECTGPLTCSEQHGCQLHCFNDAHEEVFQPRNFSGLENHLADLNGCENTLVLRYNKCTDHPCDYPSGKLRIVDKSGANFTAPSTDLLSGHLNTLCDCKTCECTYCKICDDCDDCASCDERELYCDCEVSWLEEFSKPVVTRNTGITDSCVVTTAKPTTKMDSSKQTTTKSSKPPVSKPVLTTPKMNTPSIQPEVKPPATKPPSNMVTHGKDNTDDGASGPHVVAATGGAAITGISVFMCLAVCLLVFIVCKTRNRGDPPRRPNRQPTRPNNISFAEGNFHNTLPSYAMAVGDEVDSTGKRQGENNVGKPIYTMYGNPGYSCPAYGDLPCPDYSNPQFQVYDNPPPYEPGGTELSTSTQRKAENEQLELPKLQNTAFQHMTQTDVVSPLETVLNSPGTSV